MKEHPILFSGAMVRAILEGRKTQTRRVLKPQPFKLSGPDFDGLWSDTIDPVVRIFTCPYGQVGDRLWVRETWADANGESGPMVIYAADHHHRFLVDESYPVDYSLFPSAKFSMWGGDLLRGAPGHSWRPSIHMPRWASRITLEITGVRVERLHEISEEDAISEGIEPVYENGQRKVFSQFIDLWDSINTKPGKRWEDNPWVWVVEFKRVESAQ